MLQDYNKEDAFEEAQEAKKLLEHPLIIRFFKEYNEAFINRWRQSQDAGEREDIHKSMKCLDKFKQYLDSYIVTGRLMEKALDDAKRDSGVI